MKIIDIAASLLNENYYIVEAADAVARQGVTRWLKNEFPFIKYGKNPEDPETNEMGLTLPADENGNTRTNIQSIFDKANFEFGHPLNTGLEHKMKFTEKYLPGAVRIAFTDCGWMTDNENRNKLKNLKLIYAGLFFDWWDGCEFNWVEDENNGHWVANNPGYKGLIVGATEAESADFNGLSYHELYNQFKDLIPIAKDRLAAQNSGRDITAEEEQSPVEPAVVNNTPYHIEYIPDFATSKTWRPYTNQVKSSENGCTWCITHKESFWNDYSLGRNKYAYFCWKAPSKEALMEMNTMDDRPGHYYSFCSRDAEESKIDKAPLNEYGLSLISVMVRDDGEGQPEFVQATSRYNHYGPDGNWHGGLYGDNLVNQGDRGYNDILRILNMDDAEFKRSFALPNSGYNQDHSAIVEKINTYRENNKLSELIGQVTITGQYSNGYIIKDKQSYNFLRTDGTLISNTWFNTIDAVTARYNNRQGLSHILYLIVRKGNLYNIISSDGKYLLDQFVINIYLNPIKTYATIEVKPGLFNIINLETGLILLKKPVTRLITQCSYGKGIIVQFKPDENYKIINLTGKVIGELINSNNDCNILYTIRNTCLIERKIAENNYVIQIININNNKVIWHKTSNGRLSNSAVYNDAAYYIAMPNNDKYIISYLGKVITVIPEGRDCAFPDIKQTGDIIQVSISRESTTKFYNANGEKLLEKSDNSKVYYADKNGFVLIDNNSNKISKHKSNGELVKTYEYISMPYPNEPYATIKEEGIFKLIDFSVDKVLFESSTRISIYLLTKINSRSKDSYIVLITSTKFYIIDNDGNKFTEIDLNNTGNNGIAYLGYDCFGYYGYDANNNKFANIIGPNGKMLFKHNFTTFQVLYFSANGIISITAGNKNYYVNANGDVSRSVEALVESYFLEDDNILID